MLRTELQEQNGTPKQCWYPAVASSTIDSKSISVFRPSDEEELRRDECYQLVAKTLLECEHSNLKVGIPWIPSFGDNQSYRVEMPEGLDAYMRECLVTVSTNVLETYCADLEDVSLGQDEIRALGLDLSSYYERYAFPVLLSLVVWVSSMVCSLQVLESHSLCLVMSTFFGLLAAAMGACLVSDTTRRTSFHWLLSREILRRHGGDPDDSSGSKVCRTNRQAVSDSV